jgi:hypothetical protein
MQISHQLAATKCARSAESILFYLRTSHFRMCAAGLIISPPLRRIIYCSALIPRGEAQNIWQLKSPQSRAPCVKGAVKGILCVSARFRFLINWLI